MSAENGQISKRGREAEADRIALGGTADAARDRERRTRAAGIYIRKFLEGKTFAAAWRELMPRSECSEGAARMRASREVAWLRHTYPLHMPALLEYHGLGEAEILARLKEQFGARTLLKKRVTRTTSAEGNLVVEEIDYVRVRDWKTHDAALGKLMLLHGHTGRMPPETPADKLKRLEESRRQQRDEEEAKLPRTTIEHPGAISEEEWTADWTAYQLEKKRLAEQELIGE